MTRVLVVGAGNAGLCAAIAAREAGAEVQLLERAPRALRGGNTAFTAGLMRATYDGADDVLELVGELSESELASTDFGSYSRQDFMETLGRITDYRCDPDLANVLTLNSSSALRWMKDHGVRFAPSYGRQAFRHDGRFTFWGGAILEVVGGGSGLVDYLFDEAERFGVVVRYETRGLGLITDETAGDGAVRGLRCAVQGRRCDFEADAVVLA